jgi:hypothetical protein
MHDSDQDRQARDRVRAQSEPAGRAPPCWELCLGSWSGNCGASVHCLSSLGSTKGLHCAKTSIERKETVWATFRYACDDGATAVSTPMRRSLRENSKSSNLAYALDCTELSVIVDCYRGRQMRGP